jgi:hypothetical protein
MKAPLAEPWSSELSIFNRHKGFNMFWPFLAATAIGTAFIKLGALSVWVTVLSQALSAMVFLFIAAILYFLVRKHKDTSQ